MTRERLEQLARMERVAVAHRSAVVPRLTAARPARSSDATGGPVAIDVLNAGQGTEQPLRAVAERYGLDIEALTAAAQAALAGPDRTVIIDLLARTAA